MQKMTIAEAIELVDKFKPNSRSDEEKIAWLNDIDTIIKEEIINTHEDFDDYPFTGYNENTPQTTELLLPRRFGKEIYRYYIELQIDIINKESSRFNNAAALYQSAMQEFEFYWHKRHMPLSF